MGRTAARSARTQLRTDVAAGPGAFRCSLTPLAVPDRGRRVLAVGRRGEAALARPGFAKEEGTEVTRKEDPRTDNTSALGGPRATPEANTSRTRMPSSSSGFGAPNT